MAEEVPVRMPKLSMAVTEGTIVRWLVDDGAAVREGDPIYLVETEKVETEVVAAVSGVLWHAASAGETHPVGTEIAVIERQD